MLLAIERELQRLGWWAAQPPSAEALASPLPFSHDRLDLAQWLQFVLIVRMKALLEAGAALPADCAIAPYAEEVLRFGEKDTERLLGLLREFDRLLTHNRLA